MSAPEGLYRRLSVRLWSDEKVRKLSPLQPSAQALWLYLLTGPHTGPIPGVFVAGHAALAESLNWDWDAFESCAQELIAAGLVVFDKETRLWWIPNAPRHNPPANPNVVRSWRSHWSLLPEGATRDAIGAALRQFFDAMSPAFTEAFDEVEGKASAKASGKASAKASGKASPNPSPKQEQEQEQEKMRARKRAASVFDASLIDLPEWLPREAWLAWVADRKERRKPITQRAAEAQIKALDDYRTEGHSPAAVIANSIAAGYQALFPPKQISGAHAQGQRSGGDLLDCDHVFGGAHERA